VRSAAPACIVMKIELIATIDTTRQRDPVTREPLPLKHEHDRRHDRRRDQHHGNVHEQRMRGQAAVDGGDADRQREGSR